MMVFQPSAGDDPGFAVGVSATRCSGCAWLHRLAVLRLTSSPYLVLCASANKARVAAEPMEYASLYLAEAAHEKRKYDTDNFLVTVGR
jgi:hypothetical protein